MSCRASYGETPFARIFFVWLASRSSTRAEDCPSAPRLRRAGLRAGHERRLAEEFVPGVPASINNSAAASLRAAAGPASAARAGTLLLVSADDGVRAMVASNLRRSGYDLVEARTGEEALAIAASHREQLAFLITDASLPGMSGADLASRLAPPLKVLVISGEPTLVANAPVLLKPFTRADLLRRVTELLNEQAI